MLEKASFTKQNLRFMLEKASFTKQNSNFIKQNTDFLRLFYLWSSGSLQIKNYSIYGRRNGNSKNSGFSLESGNFIKQNGKFTLKTSTFTK